MLPVPSNTAETTEQHIVHLLAAWRNDTASPIHQGPVADMPVGAVKAT
jgi:hypothetical protein